MTYRDLRKGSIARITGSLSCVGPVSIRWRSTVPFLCLLVSAFFYALVPVQATPTPKNVLVLSSFTDRGSFIELEPLKSSLPAHLSVPVNFSVEYLESTRFDDAGYRKSVSETLYHAYGVAKLDLVVASSYPALRFVLDYRDQIFPGVTVVFISVAPSRLQGQKIWPGVTGVMTSADIRGSLDLALRFHPDTQNIVLIGGLSEFERYWNGLFREEVRLRYGNLRLIEFVGRPASSVLDEVSTLPEHTVVFTQIVPQDSADPVLKVYDLLAAISQHFPLYSIFNYRLDRGAVGGSFPDQEAEGRRGGEIAARVLSGEKPENIPVEAGAGVRAFVDWRQLRRWNIPESLVPPGSLVLNRPPSMWELYKWRMIGAALLLVTQGVLIFGLLLHSRRRKRAEESLVRELRFETLISEILSDFMNLPPTQMESGIQRSLVRLREFLGVDRVSIFELTDKETYLRLRHSARLEGIAAAPKVLSRADFPWFFARLHATEPVVISGLDDLPSDAKGERELLGEINPGVVVIFPLNVENTLVGILSFVVMQDATSWAKNLLPQVKAASQVYANAFARELAQQALFESEARFRVMGDTAPAFIWMSDQDGKFTYLNKKTLEFTGAKAGELNGDGWCAYLHPDDLLLALEANTRALQRREKLIREYRVRRYDGVYRWMVDIGNPRFNAAGLFVGFIGSAVDVSDQKLAREALERVGGQLIAAQEKERSHIARELHDDICQRLAMLSLRIEKVTKNWSSGQTPAGDQLEQIWQQCSDLTGDVQALSHELHPSLLDNLGLATAVKSFCREFSEQSGAFVEFTSRNIPDSLPREVALALFRVVQEGLHNAAKYSGVKQFEVSLQGKLDGIELEISDRGVGFDTASVKNTEGLGLVSIQERIHLLNGTISIQSKPNAGTRIRAHVPVGQQSNALSASAG